MASMFFNSRTLMPIIITHADQFHPDEMMAIAFLLKSSGVSPNDLQYVEEGHLAEQMDAFGEDATSWKVGRTRDPQLLSKARENPHVFMIDVGADYCPEKRNFDHHHAQFQEKWPTGGAMSSAGIVWRWLRQQGKLSSLGDERLLDELEKRLVQPTDAHDNGEAKFEFANIVSGYNRNRSSFPNETSYANATFLKGISSCFDHLENETYAWSRWLEARAIVEAAWEEAKNRNSRIAILERSSPHFESARMLVDVSQGKAELLVTKRRSPPDKPDLWTVITVPEAEGDDFSMRCPIPETWRGRENIPYGNGKIIFGHKNGFMCVVEGDRSTVETVGEEIVRWNFRHPQLNLLKKPGGKP